ncbi:dethiobiotin synthase [Dolichospermum sp. ST_sed1]|nr:dethiobiotin synthase [Dolichospermum sp. ST_sed1]
MKKKVFFITGTSTDVGKTVISAAFMHYLLKNKIDAVYFKPVQTGGHDIDLNAVNSLLNYEISHISSCAQYENPLAPDQAAFLERKTEIQISDINLAIKNSNHSVIVIEGAGGLLVPLNEAGETWLDFIKQIDCETILVSQDILGMINHTSLTLDRLKIEGQKPQLVIINQYKNTLNLKSLQSRYNNQTFKTLPNIENFNVEIWNQISFELFSTLNIENIDKEETLQDLDHQYIWHPYTQHKNSKQPLVAVKAKDSTLEFNDGRKMIDG